MNNSRKLRKALEVLVYIANIEQRSYWLLKTIYFADKEHLKKYGRQIFDDVYIAMKNGPVPSFAYDILKSARGDGYYKFENPNPNEALLVPNKTTIKPGRAADLKYLSASEIECIEKAHSYIKDLSFDQLHNLSVDAAYTKADENEEMELEDIILTLDNAQEVLNYINSD